MTKEEAAINIYPDSQFNTIYEVSEVVEMLRQAFIAGYDYHEQNQWIKVEDGLPERDERPSFHEHSIWVLILYNNWWEPGYYDYSLKSWSSVTGVDGEVTHWRYINPPIQ
jgi:hypothetical protein